MPHRTPSQLHHDIAVLERHLATLNTYDRTRHLRLTAMTAARIFELKTLLPPDDPQKEQP